MAVAIDEKLLNGCSETRKLVTPLYIAFRESHRISYKKIRLLLSIDEKTVQIHWKHFQRGRLAGVENGQPPILSDEQLDQLVHFATEQFDAMRPTAPPGCST
jgi:hypothetical protein